jgi:hypothetical protein
MAAQKGFDYEQNAYNALKAFKISAGTAPAGAAHDRPDLEIKKSNDTTGANIAGCELKISPTAAGSLVVKYNLQSKKWQFSETKSQDPEKQLLIDLASQYEMLEIMNNKSRSNWAKNTPYLQNDSSGKKVFLLDNKRKCYEKDIAQYGGTNEVKIEIPASVICTYYNNKKCSYMNVGTHGFYTLNNKDPLKLNQYLEKKLPDFKDSASAKIRVRCQPKGGDDYQFVMTLEFGSVKKSPHNLAPLSSTNSVTISQFDLEKNKELLEAFRK